jgi:hypothetical protein
MHYYFSHSSLLWGFGTSNKTQKKKISFCKLTHFVEEKRGTLRKSNLLRKKSKLIENE